MRDAFSHFHPVSPNHPLAAQSQLWKRFTRPDGWDGKSELLLFSPLLRPEQVLTCLRLLSSRRGAERSRIAVRILLFRVCFVSSSTESSLLLPTALMVSSSRIDSSPDSRAARSNETLSARIISPSFVLSSSVPHLFLHLTFIHLQPGSHPQAH